ncbi:NADH oxidase [Spiroplasma corruscae]|uniref:NADH oxidase n=1 Tax=Spiroplasma corruscae TaxID=216934 RepID=A0A222ENM1_9MOLU|nr:CoA-disulfide reductase [Spiroplasma corruscae]ASP28099.1 NADH oxidase [Spiroplasma corruscae]
MKIVILGGGATGMGVAAKIKRLKKDYEVLVLETGNYVSLGACGLPYFVGNEFEDKKMLFARTIEKFNESGIDVILNSKISNINFENKKMLVNSKEIVYDKLVLATGADAFIPKIKGLENIEYHKLTKYEDAEKLKELSNSNNIKNVLIVGAGFIGMELAENLINIGKNVSIVELENQISSRLYDFEISELIKNNLEDNNIKLYLGNSVKEFISKESKILARLNSEEIECDLVVIASGFKPNTESLINSELELSSNNAIIVDKFGKTNIKDVYAGGDCCVIENIITKKYCYSPLATVASKQAKVIANNICDIKSKFNGTIQSSIIKLFDKGVARAGVTENEAKLNNLNIKTVFIKDKDHTHYLKGQKDIYIKLIMNKDDNVIIGGQMYGDKDSILRFYCIATLIWNKTKITESIEQIDLPYSPPFSKTYDIIHIALSKLLV